MTWPGTIHLPWRDLQWRTGDSKTTAWDHGGRFVSGFSGEQYALPEAAERHTLVPAHRQERGTGLRSTPPIPSIWWA